MMNQTEALSRVDALETSVRTVESLRHLATLAQFDYDRKGLLLAADQLEQYRNIARHLAGVV